MASQLLNHIRQQATHKRNGEEEQEYGYAYAHARFVFVFCALYSESFHYLCVLCFFCREQEQEDPFEEEIQDHKEGEGAPQEEDQGS